MNENPIAQLNATSIVTYLNVLASVKTSIDNANYKQISTATNHFLAAVGKDLTSTVGPELLEEFHRSEKLLQVRFHERSLADSTYQSTHSRVAALRTAALNLIADHALPSDFPGALTALIKKAGYSFQEVELRFGGATEKWRHGLSAPQERSIGKLRELEEFLGAPNALLSRLPSLTFHASVVDEIDPIDRLPVDFGRCLRLLRSSKGFTIRSLVLNVHGKCPSLSRPTISHWELGHTSPLKLERKVIEEIENFLGIHGPLLRRYDSVNASVSPWAPVRLTKKSYGFWNELLNSEFEHLTWFKSTPQLPAGLERNKDGFWAKDASRKMWKSFLRLFAGYCRQPVNEPDPMLRGSGIPDSDLSLALLLDFDLVLKFCDFRKCRNAAGKYNASTVSFVAGLRNLVHPDSGYFTQHPARFCNHPRLKDLLPSEVQVKILHHFETRQLHSVEECFVALCDTVYNRANKFLTELTRGGLAEQTRDPSRHIKRVLEHDQPLECLLKLRDRMEAVVLPPQAYDKNATHLQNIALVALMNVKPLRVRTLSDLRQGEIFRKDDGSWWAAVPRERFKNARFGARDGWFGQIHKSVWSALDRYSSVARPILAKGRPCDYFWIGRRGGRLSEMSIHGRFMAFTKAFIPEFAPTGINPHAWRKVVANDNLKSDRINAVAKSAQQLNDLPKTIMKSYAMDTDQLRNEWVDEQTDIRFKNRKES